ncbi:hypothetical protein HYC85_004894 [Camellia sinensis]|uniref:Major facilitator superfamily (MFS) profile domain-containing protein n=1 Tax=Camellia sinensis TaxID=4442 RepID=A0A7J7HYE6_CAMSI|nr:hypothetical protein HYC85_004894 [Camellia sinensis]
MGCCTLPKRHVRREVRQRATALLLAINESKASVYAYYVLRTISYIISQGSIFCISVAYVADVVEEDKRAALFSWTTGIFSFSHVLGNVLARFLPEDFIFEVSIALLVFCPLYMHLFVVETVQSTPRHRQHAPWLHEALKIVKERYNSMRHAATIVVSRCFYLQTISDAFSAQSQLNFARSYGDMQLLFKSLCYLYSTI